MFRGRSFFRIVICLPITALALGCFDLGMVDSGGGDVPADTGPPTGDGDGAAIFATEHDTVSGTRVACASCHAADGSGDIGPDIRGESGGHLQEHAQGEGRHPEGVKFPDLTPDDFDAIAIFLGGQPGGSDDDALDEDVLPGDPDRGGMLFNTEHETLGGTAIFCGSCHGSDGAGGFAPDIRGEPGPHLREHAQGDGRHPEGIKFPDLTAQDFEDIAAFLAGGVASVPEQ